MNRLPGERARTRERERENEKTIGPVSSGNLAPQVADGRRRTFRLVRIARPFPRDASGRAAKRARRPPGNAAAGNWPRGARPSFCCPLSHERKKIVTRPWLAIKKETTAALFLRLPSLSLFLSFSRSLSVRIIIIIKMRCCLFTMAPNSFSPSLSLSFSAPAAAAAALSRSLRTARELDGPTRKRAPIGASEQPFRGI